MFKVSALLAVISVGLTVWCLVEAISADDRRVRGLPRLVWILVVLLPFVGPIAWFVLGRPSAAAEQAAAAAAFAEFERPGRLDPSKPDDPARDEAYRELLRKRAEEQRRRYEQQKQDKLENDKDKDKDKPETDT